MKNDQQSKVGFVKSGTKKSFVQKLGTIVNKT